MRDAFGRGMRTVRGRERIADEDIAQRRQLLRERGIILLLALVEAQVLQHRDAARLQTVDRLHRRLADAVGCEGHRLAEQFAEFGRDRCQ